MHRARRRRARTRRRSRHRRCCRRARARATPASDASGWPETTTARDDVTAGLISGCSATIAIDDGLERRFRARCSARGASDSQSALPRVARCAVIVIHALERDPHAIERRQPARAGHREPRRSATPRRRAAAAPGRGAAYAPPVARHREQRRGLAVVAARIAVVGRLGIGRVGDQQRAAIGRPGDLTAAPRHQHRRRGGTRTSAYHRESRCRRPRSIRGPDGSRSTRADRRRGAQTADDPRRARGRRARSRPRGGGPVAVFAQALRRRAAAGAAAVAVAVAVRGRRRTPEAPMPAVVVSDAIRGRCRRRRSRSEATNA